MNSRTRDLTAGVIILLLGLTVVFVLIPFGVVEPKKIKIAALSPSYYPRLVGFILIAVGGFIVAIATRTSTDTQSGTASGVAHPQAALRFIIVLAVLAAFATLLESLGFVIMSAIALLVLLIIGGERRIAMLLGISLIAPVLLYYFFVKVPRIPIPNGVLSGLMPGA